MEARHRGTRSSLSPSIPTNLLVHVSDLEDPAENPAYYGIPATPKERKHFNRSTWVGIGIGVSILLMIAFFIISRFDMVHGALSSSTYSPSLPPNFGSTMGTYRKPSGLPSTVKIHSRLEQEHATKQERQAKLKGRDTLKAKEPTKLRSVPDSPASTAITGSVISSEPDLSSLVQIQLEKVRRLKFEQHLVMETDPIAQTEIATLQALLRQFVPQRYGPEPYFVEMKVHFPDSMTDPNLLNDGTVLIQLAPLELMPYAVFYFLQIVDTWKGGAFHRVAGHVLQAMAHTPVSSLAFQEYHPQFPHVQHSLGFAGKLPPLLL